MSGGCSTCTPLGISCEKGFLDHRHCPKYEQRGQSGTGDLIANGGEGGHRVPWIGNSLGSHGLAFVAAHGSARLIGVVGLPDAGKSTFLLMFYLLLARGNRLRAGTFAGSFTLGGWDHLAQGMRLTSPDQPRFPPHTPIGAGRCPGVLHVRLRTGPGKLTDLLLTDASGEWFREWALEGGGAGAEGARWITDHADAFLLFVDCGMFADEAKAVSTFRETSRLAERLRDQAAGRRVGVIWAKADKVPIPEFKARLDMLLSRFFPGHASFEVTIEAVHDEGTSRLGRYLEVVDWAAEPRPVGIRLPDIIPQREDLFFWIGRK